jgi:hypothetical protein
MYVNHTLRGQIMKARLVQYTLLMGFSVVMACSVGSFAAEQISHISDVFAKAMQVEH